MKLIFSCLLLLIPGLQFAQNCPDFDKLFKEGSVAKDYDLAYKKFQSAEEVACTPEQKMKASQKKDELFKKINQLRSRAEKSEAETKLANTKILQEQARANSNLYLTYALKSDDITRSFRLAEYSYRLDTTNEQAERLVINSYKSNAIYNKKWVFDNLKIQKLKFSKDGKFLLVIADSAIIIADMNGVVRKKLHCNQTVYDESYPQSEFIDADLSFDNQFFVASTFNSLQKVNIDLNNKTVAVKAEDIITLMPNMFSGAVWIESVEISKDASFVLCGMGTKDGYDVNNPFTINFKTPDKMREYDVVKAGKSKTWVVEGKTKVMASRVDYRISEAHFIGDESTFYTSLKIYGAPSNTSQIKIWDVKSGNMVKEYPYLSYATFSKDATKFLGLVHTTIDSVPYDMYPLLLDTAEYSLINFVSQADCDVNHMLFSPNEEFLLISGCQTMLRDSSGSIIKKYPYSGYPVFSPDSKYLVFESGNSVVWCAVRKKKITEPETITDILKEVNVTKADGDIWQLTPELKKEYGIK